MADPGDNFRPVDAQAQPASKPREQRESFQSAFGRAAVGLGLADSTGRFSEVNEALCRMTGYCETDLRTRSIWSLIHPDDRAESQLQIERLLVGDIPSAVLEVRCLAKSDTTVWLRVSLSVGPDDSGVPGALIATFEDIAERKRLKWEQSELRSREVQARAEADAARVQLRLIYEAFRQILESLHPETIFETVFDATRRIFEVDRVAIYFVDETGGWSSPASDGFVTDYPRRVCDKLANAPGLRRLLERFQPAVTTNLPRVVEGSPIADAVAAEGIQSVVLLPMLHRGVLVGALGLYHTRERNYGADLLQVAQSLASTVAIAIENARLYQAGQERAQEVATLYTAVKQIMGSLDLSRTLESILENIVSLLGCDAAGVMLLDQSDQSLRYEAVRGAWAQIFTGTVQRLGQGLVGQVIQSRMLVNVPDVLAETRFFNAPRIWASGLRSALYVPIEAGENAIGALVTFSLEPSHFTSARERIALGLADQAALAITHAHETAERRRAEEALRENEERFRTLVQNSTDIITIVDADGSTRYVSPSIERVLGYPVNPRIGQNTFAAAHPEDLDGILEIFADLLRSPGKTVVTEYRFRHADGSWVWLESTAQNLLADPSVHGIVVNSRDVTERKNAEQQQRESLRQLEKALADLKETQRQAIQQERLRALGQMASGIAHDFNNTLAHIVGYIDLLLNVHPQNLEKPAIVREYLEVMNTAASDAVGIVNRLREFYRYREESDTVRPVDLNQIVREAVALTQPRWRDQALANGCVIQVLTELNDLPPLPGNEAELREALTNLIFNAVDALPHGGAIVFQTHFAEGRAVLRVVDNGIGMTEDVRQRCLEPFFTTKGQTGSGMGLAMVYGIVQRHKGQIAVESAVGEGTAVVIELPVEQAGGNKVEPATAAEAAQRGRQILVVEDEAPLREILRGYLEADGHSVVLAANGRDGLERFGQGTFDLVITDRAMPEIGGDQLAVVVKQFAPSLPVILLTGFGEFMKESGVPRPGIDLIVGKPVTRLALRQAIAKVLEE